MTLAEYLLTFIDGGAKVEASGIGYTIIKKDKTKFWLYESKGKYYIKNITNHSKTKIGLISTLVNEITN